MSIGLEVHDRRDGVEEGELVLAGQLQDRRGRGAGEVSGPGGDDDAVPVGGRQAGDLLARDGDQRVGRRAARVTVGREAVAVDRQRAAGRQLVGVGRAP